MREKGRDTARSEDEERRDEGNQVDVLRGGGAKKARCRLELLERGTRTNVGTEGHFLYHILSRCGGEREEERESVRGSADILRPYDLKL